MSSGDMRSMKTSNPPMAFSTFSSSGRDQSNLYVKLPVSSSHVWFQLSFSGTGIVSAPGMEWENGNEMCN